MPGLQDYGKPVRKIRQTDGNVRLFFAKKRKIVLAAEGKEGENREKSPMRGGGEFTPNEQKV